MTHKTKPVKLYSGEILSAIDLAMVRFVRLLNRCDMWTTCCCQGDSEKRNPAYIAVAGISALPFAHAILDDQFKNPGDSRHLETLTVGGFPGDNTPITIEWSARQSGRVFKRLERVLSTLPKITHDKNGILLL
jgi:hypothetical protein